MNLDAFTGIRLVEQIEQKFLHVRVCLKKRNKPERPKSASYLRLKSIQGKTIGNIWKKKLFFFSKKVFGKKRHIARKPKKNL